MMNKNKIITALLAIVSWQGAIAQSPTPAPNQSKSVLITGLVIHVGDGKKIENGGIGFRNGKIDLVADMSVIKLKANAYDTSINFNAAHAYPSFIAANSTLGLNEVDAVRATNDFAEVGEFNPHVRALIAFNSDSKVNSTVRTNGVLMAQVTPSAGIISGKSSVLALEGWNWEDALIKADEGIHLHFPEYRNRNNPSDQNGKENKALQEYQKKLNDLMSFMEASFQYCKNNAPSEINLRYEAMRGLFNGNKTLYIHVQNAKEIQSALQFIKPFNIAKVSLVGARDAYKVLGLLKESKVSVMLARVHSLPTREHDDVDMPFKLPAFLYKEGIPFCLQNAGDMEGMNSRNIPFLAGTARAYGLPEEEAIASISLNTAKILGIDKDFGSITEGKSASFFISKGDALDMRTNEVLLAFVNGKKLDLRNTQMEQYKRYMEKYGIK
jgi:imidazolonepropionase-like amidohydrolase